MAITSGFFNSVNGDRKYNAEQINEFFGGLIASGVLPNPSTNLQVIAKSGMTVQVQAGKGYIDSHWIKNDNLYDLTIPTADSVLPRIDAVIMELDESTDTRAITLKVKKGKVASSPTAPTMTRGTHVKQYCLATVYVGKAVTSVSQSNITDTRADTNVCGWVTALITQVDTSTLFAQWQAAYEEQLDKMKAWETAQESAYESWFNSLTSDLTVNTYIQEYQNTVTIDSAAVEGDGAKVIGVGIADYSPASDVLFVNVNGITLVKGADYTISGTGTNAKITVTNELSLDAVVEFRVLKSKIGQKA